MFPSFMLPEAIKLISKVTPVFWAMQGFNDVFCAIKAYLEYYWRAEFA